jgi:hypothetical protein
MCVVGWGVGVKGTKATTNTSKRKREKKTSNTFATQKRADPNTPNAVKGIHLQDHVLRVRLLWATDLQSSPQGIF